MRKDARILLGALVSAAAVFAIIRNVSLTEVAHATAGANKTLVVFGTVALALGYAIRSFRWWRMLRLVNPSISLGTTSRVLMAGFAANNLLPLRAGDALRGFGFRAVLNAPTSFVVATLALERLLDLASLLVLGLSLIKFGGLTTLPHNIVRLVQALSLFSLALLALAFAFGKQIRQRLLLFLGVCVHQAEKRSKLELAIVNVTSLFESIKPVEAIHLTILSVAAWLLEALLYISVAKALHLQVALVWACMALVAANFAAIIPSSPGYVGTFHASVLAILLVAGVERNSAAAYAVGVHAVLWFTVTFAGAIAYFSLRVKAIQTLPDSKGEVV
jgi:glycosyltransferase 2 family protein